MTMTPEQAYNELVDVYIETTKNPYLKPGHIRAFAKSYESWAAINIRCHGWTYRRAEIMVNRCRKLAPIALQHQP
jgi:hypothetical protein